MNNLANCIHLLFLNETFALFYSGNNLNPVVELFFGQSNVEGVYEGKFCSALQVLAVKKK